MEPTSLTAAAIATMIATKAIEKNGEKITDVMWNLVGKFLTALRKKDPATATAIEEAAKTPQLNEQQTKELIVKVEAVAATDSDVRQAAQKIQTAIQAQPGAIFNMTQLAEKIGVVNQGTIVNQTNTIPL